MIHFFRPHKYTNDTVYYSPYDIVINTSLEPQELFKEFSLENISKVNITEDFSDNHKELEIFMNPDFIDNKNDVIYTNHLSKLTEKENNKITIVAYNRHGDIIKTESYKFYFKYWNIESRRITLHIIEG